MQISFNMAVRPGSHLGSSLNNKYLACISFGLRNTTVNLCMHFRYKQERGLFEDILFEGLSDKATPQRQIKNSWQVFSERSHSG